MKPIISPEWYPVTHDIGVIEAPLETVVKTLIEWNSGLGIDLGLDEVRSSVQQALSTLPPLTAIMGKVLLVALRNGWTAFFQNGILGSDPFGPMSYMAHELLDTRAMRICCSIDGNIWEVYASARLGGSTPLGFLRTLSACRDDSGRWVFSQSGEPFSFEDVSIYARTKIRERLTDELFDRYLHAFGLEVFDPDFFIVSGDRRAIALTRTNMPAGFKTFTLQEVREGKPWQK
jgi:hypothetical protein